MKRVRWLRAVLRAPSRSTRSCEGRGWGRTLFFSRNQRVVAPLERRLWEMNLRKFSTSQPLRRIPTLETFEQVKSSQVKSSQVKSRAIKSSENTSCHPHKHNPKDADAAPPSHGTSVQVRTMVALELQLGAAAGVPDGEFLRFQLCPFDSWDGSGMGVCASSGAMPECGDGSAHCVDVLHVGVKRDPTNFSTSAMRVTL